VPPSGFPAGWYTGVPTPVRSVRRSSPGMSTGAGSRASSTTYAIFNPGPGIFGAGAGPGTILSSQLPAQVSWYSRSVSRFHAAGGEGSPERAQAACTTLSRSCVTARFISAAPS
jgi:hypothetical protein